MSATRRPWLSVVSISLAQLMVALDATIVTLALPVMQHELGASAFHRAWAISAYSLALAAGLLPGGALVDRLGPRRVFLAAVAAFAAASALAGLAVNFVWLVAGRLVQGSAAAAMIPAGLALLSVTFDDAGRLRRAYGVYGGIASSGGALGLLIGGQLIASASWRWCLLINVAVAAIILAGSRSLPERAATRQGPIDWSSAALTAVGLAGLLEASTCIGTAAWPAAAGLSAVTLVVSTIAWRRQRRVENPLIPRNLLADARRQAAFLALAASVVAMFGLFVVLTYQLQETRGLNPAASGIVFLPLSIGSLLGGMVIAGRSRMPPVRLLALGLAALAVALAVLAAFVDRSIAALLPCLLLAGLGAGSLFAPALTLVTRTVDPRDTGTASAAANACMQAASAIGAVVVNMLSVHFGPRMALAVCAMLTASAWLVVRNRVATTAA